LKANENTESQEELALKTAPRRISHVGIAVNDLERAITDFGLVFDSNEVERLEVGGESVRVAMIKIGNSEVELLSPTGEGGAIAKFLRERGEGIHHLAITVPDVSKALESAKRMGLRVVDEVPRKGARGTEAAFVHPKSMHGVLIELYNR
jgi:methylmalonyl-CoA/ethylmalonyl-CoA epimerase